MVLKTKYRIFLIILVFISTGNYILKFHGRINFFSRNFQASYFYFTLQYNYLVRATFKFSITCWCFDFVFWCPVLVKESPLIEFLSFVGSAGLFVWKYFPLLNRKIHSFFIFLYFIFFSKIYLRILIQFIKRFLTVLLKFSAISFLLPSHLGSNIFRQSVPIRRPCGTAL